MYVDFDFERAFKKKHFHEMPEPKVVNINFPKDLVIEEHDLEDETDGSFSYDDDMQDMVSFKKALML